MGGSIVGFHSIQRSKWRRVTLDLLRSASSHRRHGGDTPGGEAAMGADAVIKWLMPKEERFHELLAKDTANLVRGARLFADIAGTANLEKRRVKHVELKALEHDGDGITRQIFDALNSTFITPFDREDIRELATD